MTNMYTTVSLQADGYDQFPDSASSPSSDAKIGHNQSGSQGHLGGSVALMHLAQGRNGGRQGQWAGREEIGGRTAQGQIGEEGGVLPTGEATPDRAMMDNIEQLDQVRLITMRLPSSVMQTCPLLARAQPSPSPINCCVEFQHPSVLTKSHDILTACSCQASSQMLRINGQLCFKVSSAV